ncbi:DNA-binding GntR family transcriptional regulator [Paenibacillus sp. V4I3]|uniref:GntR family transcriptional regulator n=1 Tax=Paenibacillus sp. V4I3 TaxID=3042305 RepID=UPI002781A136|nr:GntR family transcriptional regulator [Paenibacillus sp. V4I3]MDQ0873895.1 DNA-binding GntR family transcriptional regulator [Paenibacillus sp. V4I3]
MSLYEKIYSHLLDEIKAGRLKPGDRIPSENELSTQFSVSRITSKKALEMLAQHDWIERLQGKGSYVAQKILNYHEQQEAVPSGWGERDHAASPRIVQPHLTRL